jgi:glyoxylase-like metal-dependent hydrolase (beta-lactamase superfamily II)
MDALRNLPGWHLLGAFPEGEPDEVGSWILHNDGEALLLEVPPGLTRAEVKAGLEATRAGLRYVTASHLHEDHLDAEGWKELEEFYAGTHFIRPAEAKAGSETVIKVGGEPVWLIKAPKHSPSDTVVVFRGVAMTGDIELGTLESVNGEVSRATRAASMEYLRDFEERSGYRIHTIVSAHLNDFRQGVDWASLFEVG